MYAMNTEAEVKEIHEPAPAANPNIINQRLWPYAVAALGGVATAAYGAAAESSQEFNTGLVISVAATSAGLYKAFRTRNT